MLTELCQYLHNWFDRDQKKFFGHVEIADGEITCNGEEVDLLESQHFRIIGSLLNDGVHQYPSEGLKDESFDGAIWSMAIPPTVLSLSEEINAWQTKYGSLDSVSMSPYNSESFGGYSYNKATPSSAESGGLNGWQSIFANRLNPWRKLP